CSEGLIQEQQLFQDLGYKDVLPGCSMIFSTGGSLIRNRLQPLKGNAMLKEYHYDHLVRWPRAERAAVFLTFDFQAGEAANADKKGVPNFEMWGQGEYGPPQAI